MNFLACMIIISLWFLNTAPASIIAVLDFKLLLNRSQKRGFKNIFWIEATIQISLKAHTGVNISTQKQKLFPNHLLKTGNFSQGNLCHLLKNQCSICCINTDMQSFFENWPLQIFLLLLIVLKYSFATAKIKNFSQNLWIW